MSCSSGGAPIGRTPPSPRKIPEPAPLPAPRAPRVKGSAPVIVHAARGRPAAGRRGPGCRTQLYAPHRRWRTETASCPAAAGTPVAAGPRPARRHGRRCVRGTGPVVIHGVDVSDHQVANSATTGLDFAISKITEGTGYVKPKGSPQRATARAVGLVTGFHHVGRPGSMTAQVDHFLSKAALAPRGTGSPPRRRPRPDQPGHRHPRPAPHAHPARHRRQRTRTRRHPGRRTGRPLRGADGRRDATRSRTPSQRLIASPLPALP
ncbi:GH25 family lysozyme [Streptomyces sp. NPDC006733]|uniref:GH25 family lysozyme n=1 Tax=Streptomyces sp. NPDC006733 TaxID=3155460 RepID=UPI0033FAF0F4